MATITDSEGNVISDFTIGSEGIEETVKKKQGRPAKLDAVVRKMFGASIPQSEYDRLVAKYGSATKAVNKLIELERGING